jgi:hypothetical protein
VVWSPVSLGRSGTWVQWDSVQLSPSVLALETEQSCVLRWGVTSVEDICGRALIECVQEGGSCGPDAPFDSVCRHGDKRESQEAEHGVSGLQARVAVKEGAPQRCTEGGTGRCVGSGRHKVKL